MLADQLCPHDDCVIDYSRIYCFFFSHVYIDIMIGIHKQACNELFSVVVCCLTVYDRPF